MKLIGIMHVKDAIRTIEECLEKLSSLVDEIIIVDNGSTDGTLETYKKFSKIAKLRIPRKSNLVSPTPSSPTVYMSY